MTTFFCPRCGQALKPNQHETAQKNGYFGHCARCSLHVMLISGGLDLEVYCSRDPAKVPKVWSEPPSDEEGEREVEKA